MKQIIKSIFVILVLLQSLYSLNAQQTFLTAIPTESSLTASIKGDIKIKVASATNTGGLYNYGNEGPISYSYDNNYDSWYHSSENQFPITLDYNFFADTIPQMDYLIYHPRSSGINGIFQLLEIWYATQENSTLTKLGDFDFQGTAAAQVVNFEPALVHPTKVRFIVKSGVGGFASCAEMEFYRKNPEAFDYTSVFADEICSALKPGVTLDDINAINEGFYKKLASDMYHGFFDPEFRVQEYRAWEHPDKKAAKNKTASYSLLDNPTGIYVSQGEDLIVFVGDTHGQSLSLRTHDLSTGGWGTQKTYALKQGLNKIRITAKGLAYVQYYNDLGATAPKVKINFVTGAVNGYFDSQKHQVSDWSRLLNKAVAPDFDLLGQFAHITFPVANFKSKTPDGKALIDAWDKLVRLEHEIMGLYKYPDHKFQNRIYAHADYNPDAAWMYATSYHTGYSPGSWNGMVTLSVFSAGDIWGPAHEIGHVNQVRPGVKWLGMTEVTNNIYSLHVQTSFGNVSRLQSDNVYSRAFAKASEGVAHQDLGDLFFQLVPFWQLKLYLVDVLGKEDFYRDLFHHYMTTPDPTTPATDAKYQLNFVRVACDIAQLNLLDFFEKWGFLTPVNKTVNDYGSSAFIVTQEQIDALKAEIEAKNYPAPPKDFSRITDSNKGTY